jgi:hypothetical protein
LNKITTSKTSNYEKINITNIFIVHLYNDL